MCKNEFQQLENVIFKKYIIYEKCPCPFETDRCRFRGAPRRLVLYVSTQKEFSKGKVIDKK